MFTTILLRDMFKFHKSDIEDTHLKDRPDEKQIERIIKIFMTNDGESDKKVFRGLQHCPGN